MNRVLSVHHGSSTRLRLCRAKYFAPPLEKGSRLERGCPTSVIPRMLLAGIQANFGLDRDENIRGIFILCRRALSS
jgi:hypothetical protein